MLLVKFSLCAKINKFVANAITTNPAMLILGIDPGTATTGFGLIKINGSDTPTLVNHGLIETEKNGNPGPRLVDIYKQMVKLLSEYKPDAVAIEKIFFFANAKTVISVSQAQGVLMMAAAESGVKIYEYAPGQVKLQIGGSGKADKKIIKKTIFKMFRLKAQKNKKTHFDNVADAIAIALCHAKLSYAKLTSSDK